MRHFRQERSTPIAVSTLLLLVAGACADPVAPPSQARPGGLSLLDAGQPGVGVWVCKVSTVPGTFTFNATASNTEGTLAPSPISVDVLTAGSDPAEYCSRVWTPGTNEFGPTTDVTVSENVPAGYQVDSIMLVTTPPGGRTIYYDISSLTVTASYTQGYLVKFFNSQTICKDQNATNYGQPGECKYPPPPGMGCTPGYWKVSQHWDSWPAGYTPSQTLATYFPAASGYTLNGRSLGSYSLVQGLAFRGGNDASGAARILLRAAVAGLLNSASSFGGYPMTTSQLVSAVNAALASGDRATMIALASTIDSYNNAGCPLN